VLPPVGILVYLWSLDPPLTVAIGMFLPLALLGPGLFRQATRHTSNWHWRAYTSFAALVLDSLQGLPTLKAFARGKRGDRRLPRSPSAPPLHHHRGRPRGHARPWAGGRQRPTHRPGRGQWTLCPAHRRPAAPRLSARRHRKPILASASGSGGSMRLEVLRMTKLEDLDTAVASF
jgi:hypothetical protein